MATIHGRKGSVTISGQTVAAVTAFSYEESADQVETTSMSDTSKQYETGLVDGSGTIECRFDYEDYDAEDGQGTGLDALRAGTSVAVVLTPSSEVSSGEFITLSGSAVVTSYSYSQSFDDAITCSFGFQGVLTRTTS